MGAECWTQPEKGLAHLAPRPWHFPWVGQGLAQGSLEEGATFSLVPGSFSYLPLSNPSTPARICF